MNNIEDFYISFYKNVTQSIKLKELSDKSGGIILIK